MLTDIEIAQSTVMSPIKAIGEKIGISEDDLEFYGKYKAKISDQYWEKVKNRDNGKLVLVTAINPTPAGEGKTTTTVGLGDAMTKIGKNTIIALREPSLGPVMGIKGGAAGGGYAQVVPMEDINLHFTGDMHAITSANNLLCAMMDNHIQQGNTLGIDVRSICFKRVLDMNDRALRNIVIGLGGKFNGVPREDGFMITVASEVMAILCLSLDMDDLKCRLANIIVAYNFEEEPVFAEDLRAEGAMALLLKDAIKPNLVQTLEHTPCFIHGGPFANIAHGCNSIKATRLALKTADYVITEAGFGADLGAEKFIDIKCRFMGVMPQASVIVATVRALKYNGGINKNDLKTPNVDAIKKGIENLGKHIENMGKFATNVIVAINKFDTDSVQELSFIENYCKQKGAYYAISEVFEKGSEGGIELAKLLVDVLEKPVNPHVIYDENASICDKIDIIVKEIYGGELVNYSLKARRQIKLLEYLGLDKKPICMAKTQYSLSDNPNLLARPTGFAVNVSDIKISNGAGFIVALTGDIMTMPGLPKVPSAEKIDIDENGTIVGLF